MATARAYPSMRAEDAGDVWSAPGHSHSQSECESPGLDAEDMYARPKDVPEHPIPAMQQAFAESYIEATTGTAPEKPKLRTRDAKGRREELLDQDEAAEPPSALWRYRPGQKCHELRKLMAQVSFGVYLLLNGLANSNAQVVSILQGHIDEIDEFLEMVMEDIDLASADLTERIDFLKLPMDNMTVFTTMLEDRAFRLQIVEGNAKIEHILSRTTTALVQSAQDVSEGLKSTKQFTAYLESEENGHWRAERGDVIDIFDAMRGNTEGWLNAFMDLQSKSNALNALIVKLDNMVALIDRTAGKVSRRTRFSIQPFTTPDQQSRPSSQSSGECPSSPPSQTPPASVPAAPPRLSLRFSRTPEDRTSDRTYFDLPVRSSFFPINMKAPEEAPRASMGLTLKPVAYTPPDAHVDSDSDSETSQDTAQPTGIIVRNESPVRPDSPTNDGALFLLQPRTYTPVPPAPLPSPRVIGNAASSNGAAILTPDIPPRDRRPSPSPRRPDIQPRGDSGSHIPSNVRAEAKLVQVGSPRLQIGLDTSLASRHMPSSSPRSAPVSSGDDGLRRPGRTSLRQRVSLKTNPPESIHVPPPDAPELQRPVFASPRTFQAYETFVGPDSAYGSDNERTAVNSMADPAPVDFSPPVFPGILPSPHSDQQYFRPVQASPHSPLQQRPHTSGTSAPRYLHHQRNAPSAMGMSMLSSVSTLNHDASEGRTVKKKRSAFGWLKKAFSLDEEERMAFEQRKNEQSKNLYYDNRSPKYLDGKRIR
ncbi:hypothetical protein GGTG_00980 [Gaeumannomyces tritici R3-111a-1]|uniref:Uncharacterized protein n=1 Tax=Gaeumannomyces tritici (strain R3-111a-1) TaxID=644352 RepID=J3NI97_GAET3|nr:hypothetical protein GGTG_00980 [Gaeumannomyces tritici R3-111a-1]EJT80990.1 hypothetical protein GGTG_00980 [Gaeumannomyces tritici R3-111a-1]